jgi:hypothetical protein
MWRIARVIPSYGRLLNLGRPNRLRPSRGALPGPSRTLISLQPVRRGGSRSRCLMRCSSWGISWKKSPWRSLSKFRSIFNVVPDGRRRPVAQLLAVDRRPPASPARVMIGRSGLSARAARRIKVSDMRPSWGCIPVYRTTMWSCCPRQKKKSAPHGP